MVTCADSFVSNTWLKDHYAVVVLLPGESVIAVTRVFHLCRPVFTQMHHKEYSTLYICKGHADLCCDVLQLCTTHCWTSAPELGMSSEGLRS